MKMLKTILAVAFSLLLLPMSPLLAHDVGDAKHRANWKTAEKKCSSCQHLTCDASMDLFYKHMTHKNCICSDGPICQTTKDAEKLDRILCSQYPLQPHCGAPDDLIACLKNPEDCEFPKPPECNPWFCPHPPFFEPRLVGGRDIKICRDCPPQDIRGLDIDTLKGLDRQIFENLDPNVLRRQDFEW